MTCQSNKLFRSCAVGRRELYVSASKWITCAGLSHQSEPSEQRTMSPHELKHLWPRHMAQWHLQMYQQYKHPQYLCRINLLESTYGSSNACSLSLSYHVGMIDVVDKPVQATPRNDSPSHAYNQYCEKLWHCEIYLLQPRQKTVTGTEYQWLEHVMYTWQGPQLARPQQLNVANEVKSVKQVEQGCVPVDTQNDLAWGEICWATQLPNHIMACIQSLHLM